MVETLVSRFRHPQCQASMTSFALNGSFRRQAANASSDFAGASTAEFGVDSDTLSQLMCILSVESAPTR